MKLKTEKQRKYFKKVISLHYEKGYGEDRISRIVPIGHTTVSRWISIYALENEGKNIQMRKSKTKSQQAPVVTQVQEIKSLELEISRLQSLLKQERLRADGYEEMINVAETKFNISIRKKAGAKQ